MYVLTISYCFVSFDGEFIQGTTGHSINIHPATKEQRDLLFQKMKEAGYEWDAEKLELKRIESAEWSEDDQSDFNELSSFILETYRTEDASRLIIWLKSLKDRVQPQQEWSEEDEIMLRRCISATFDHGYLKECDWLKSIRPHNTWKPSDEQIKVCKEVYADILSAKGFDLGTVNGELNRLEEQLKKLREE